MRIGINVPNELLERLAPYKHVVNISKICREAIKNWIDTFERAQDRVNEEDIKDVAMRLQSEIKSYEVDWEAIGREDAKMWAQMATLENFEHLFYNIKVHKRHEREPGPFLGPRIEGVPSYINRRQEHNAWFERQFDIDNGQPEDNPYLTSEQQYNRGWIAYLTAVWDVAKRGTDLENKLWAHRLFQ